MKTKSFAELIGKNITPIKQKNISPQFKPREKTRQHAKIEAQNKRNITATNLPKEAFDPLSPAQWHAMENKKVTIQREIDFHGYYADEAYRLLSHALDNRKNRKPQHWLIIHGKGNHSAPYEKAPLKHTLYELIYQHPAISAAIAQIDKDGKSGAILLRIRPKQREKIKTKPF